MLGHLMKSVISSGGAQGIGCFSFARSKKDGVSGEILTTNVNKIDPLRSQDFLQEVED